MNMDLARAILSTIPKDLPPHLFNPWVESCEFDLLTGPDPGPPGRLKRLAMHLTRNPRFILVGEAPGFQGCRYTGLPFTSEAQLCKGLIPGQARIEGRLTNRHRPYSEPSATMVWEALEEHDLDGETVLWNALPVHPHKPGNHQSNRTPVDAELQLGHGALLLLSRAFPKARFVPIGAKAQASLAAVGVAAEQYVRHPANGGKAAFGAGLAALVKR
jgi:hypothetical protein